MSDANVIIARCKHFHRSGFYNNSGRQQFTREMLLFCGTDLVFDRFTSISQFSMAIEKPAGVEDINGWFWVSDWLEDIVVGHYNYNTKTIYRNT